VCICHVGIEVKLKLFVVIDVASISKQQCIKLIRRASDVIELHQGLNFIHFIVFN